jgi:hypothetical protein
MTAIWENDGTGWRLMAPSGFPDEAALHALVEQAPNILPLAGGPRLVVLGREVLLGANWADLIAVEPSGRLAILEIKLAKNAEARRAVVAQILTYAAYLRGMDPITLERDILGTHLHKRGYETLAQAVIDGDQEGAFDAAAFGEVLATSLAEGRFRLVLVLDEAPPELVRLVGYLGAVSDKLIIDLVTVVTYSVGGSQVVVPQRVDSEREPELSSTGAKPPAQPAGQLVEGKDAFMATIEHAPVTGQPLLRRLVEWAAELEAEGVAKLWTFHGKARTTLLPRLSVENVGLVTIWNDNGPALTIWRSVFERRAPETLKLMEQSPDMPKIGQGTNAAKITDALLARLTEAYREAAGGAVDSLEAHHAASK